MTQLDWQIRAIIEEVIETKGLLCVGHDVDLMVVVQDKMQEAVEAWARDYFQKECDKIAAAIIHKLECANLVNHFKDERQLDLFEIH